MKKIITLKQLSPLLFKFLLFMLMLIWPG